MMIRIRSMKDRLHLEEPKSASRRSVIYAQSLKWIALGALLTQLFVSYGFGAGPWIPQDLEPQIWSRVEYDPELKDPLFMNPVKDPPRIIRTAELLCNDRNYWHVLYFCKAGLLGEDTIQLYVPDQYNITEHLGVLIRDGKFSCQYWNNEGHGAYTWTTTRQKLVLDKKMYRKGDVIKGRIDFECVMEPINRDWIWKHGKRPQTIHVYGVFKPTVE